MSNRKYLLAIIWFLAISPCLLWAQENDFGRLKHSDRNHSSSIQRKSLVRRHNPQISHIGKHQFLLGEGKTSFWVDATALQTFVPDTKWGLNVSLGLTDTTRLSRLHMELDRWTGKADSRFHYNGQYYHIETICSPSANGSWWAGYKKPMLATRISSDSIFDVIFLPESIQKAEKSEISLTTLKHHAAVGLHVIGEADRWYTIVWRGNATIKKRDGKIVLHCKGNTITSEGKKQKDYSVDIAVQEVTSKPNDYFFNNGKITPFTDHALRTATGWSTFWTECGLADFSATDTPEARKVEERQVETLYNITALTPKDWWSQAPLTVYGFAKQLVPDFQKIIKEAPEQLWQRPEFIAAALLTLRAYTYPTVVERFSLTPEDVKEFHTTIINTYAPYISKAAEYLKTENPPVPSFLDNNALLAVAKRWMVEAESVDVLKETLSESNSRVLPADGLMFHMPMVTEMLSPNDLTVNEQSLLLFSIANRRWPSSWKVKTEFLVPLP